MLFIYQTQLSSKRELVMSSQSEQLAQAQEELSNLKAEYEEFVYIISHDLKAPFRTIDGFATIIAEKNKGEFNEKTQRYLGLIAQGAKEGDGIINALLDFSRLNTHAAPFEEVDFNSVCKDVMRELTVQLHESEAEVTIAELPVLTADKQQIRQVFYHLLKNALTYHQQGKKAVISISVQQHDDEYEFCIKDNGIGIKQARHDTVFKVLKRAVTQQDYPGAGMGLPIVRKVLQRHGGNIRLESEVNEGSAFYFTVSRLLKNQA